MATLTIQQAFDLALQHHQSGRLPEADQLYRLILAQQPDNAHALHLLGVVANQTRRNDIAVDLIRRAIALKPNYHEAYCNLAHALKENGQLDEAIAAYRQAIAIKPDNPDVQNDFANALRDKGALDEAIAAYRQAITLRSDYAEAHNNLGVALRDKGEFDEAIASYRLAIALKPDCAEAFNNLGFTLNDKGQPDEAITAFRRAIALKPKYVEAHRNLANVLKENRQLDEAIAVYRQAILLKHDAPEVHNNLGIALRDKGQLDQAISAYRQAIALKPDSAEIYNNLGVALSDLGQLTEAIAGYRQAIALKPDYAEAHNNLGVALNDKEQVDEAIAAFRRAIALKPDYALAFSNLGNSLKNNGKIDEAVTAFRQATILDPDNAALASNLVYVLHLHPGYDAAALAEEHRNWDHRHGRPLRKFTHSKSNHCSPDRRLRIGYVSPDFREHCASFFILPLLSNHDHQNFEIFCYGNVMRPDSVTQQLRAHADGWRDVYNLSDEELARTIHEDRIDVLVDLTMHMINGRPLTFARKPAPVQVAWLGYPGTTGLEAMDYRLTDSYLDPPGSDESVYAEKSVRLPDSFWCYDPRVSDLSVSETPALVEGRVTFGCLNNFCKVNADVLKLWGAVLAGTPDSRMLILAPHGSHRQWALDEMARQGVAPSRIEFLNRRPRPDYLQLYNRIDICLDTFPYNGHTTQLDAMWMGVPTVTLVGKTAVGRGGLSILSNVGLQELVARSQDQYVEIAAQLASDLPSLSQLRSTLRDRMQRSPLMDAPRFVRNIETAYRQMWREWCRT